MVSIPADEPDLTDVIPDRNGTDLQRLAYDVRDARLIAECRATAIELPTWLPEHLDEHMKTEPIGLPTWINALAQFGLIERGRLRNVLHYVGCIHETGWCRAEAPVCCTACEGSQQ